MRVSKSRQERASFLPTFMLILCIIQPVLDVASFWLDRLGLSNAPTTALRFLMLALVVGVGFILSERKGYYLGLAGVLAALTAGHILACAQWSYDAPLVDLANALRIYQLPMMTLSFITMVRKEPACIESIKKGFLICLAVCASVEIVSVLTDTNPYTYRDQKTVGICGWFYFANSQSAILTMLVPVSICYVLEKTKKTLPILLASVTGLGVLYFFATRLAFAALVGTGFGVAVCLFFFRKTMDVKKPAIILVVCTVIALAAVPLSPMVKNDTLVARNKILKQQDIDAMVAADEAAAIEAGLEGEALSVARLASAYDKYLPGLSGHFGLERTAELYDRSTDAGDIADVRRARLNFCKLLLEDQPGLSFWFGMEREDMSHDGITYDVENDLHGIFYLCGAVGLVLMLLFLGWFLFRIVVALRRDFRSVFTLQAVGCGIALLCCLIHAYCTAGVLRRPNVTFYLAALLAVSYGLTQKTRSDHET
ncbi:MAG: O-antigen ligase family protein [Oscillospiraceae bacterium]|nr:O-antigen ligase family protein [Oscillospiraceae bacterium]